MDFWEYCGLCAPYLFLQFRKHVLPKVLRGGLKVLPIVVLTNYTVKSGAKRTNYRTLIGAGLVMSMAGDLFLDSDMFLEGLSAFLVGHIFYTVAFTSAPVKAEITSTSSLAVACGLYGFAAGIVAVLYGHTEPKLLTAMGVYAFVITTMAHRAFLLCKHERKAFLGALIFILSDSIIAVNKFYTPIPGAHFMIMLTYYLGQYGIASSAAKPFKLSKD